jgi:iron complex transport system ATP-binding protein
LCTSSGAAERRRTDCLRSEKSLPLFILRPTPAIRRDRAGAEPVVSVAFIDMHALTVETVSFQYDPGIPILRDVSLAVRSGEILSIVGPNGAGKSTLLRLLDRILIPLHGRIFLGDRSLARFTRAELARRISFVPQDGAVAFPFTVLEIVLMGRSPHIRGAAFENEHDRERALDMMRLTDILHLRDQPITALSGGERQRAWIARALAQEPEIILLDEPSAHLDIAHQLEVVRILRDQNRAVGLTVVSVSHDLNLAAAFSDRIAMLRGGELSALGTPTEVLTENRIREVFGTSVVVDPHPEGSGPRVTLLSGRLTHSSG